MRLPQHSHRNIFNFIDLGIHQFGKMIKYGTCVTMQSPDFNNAIPIWGATTRAAAKSVCSSPSKVPDEGKKRGEVMMRMRL